MKKHFRSFLNVEMCVRSGWVGGTMYLIKLHEKIHLQITLEHKKEKRIMEILSRNKNVQ